MKHRFDCPPKCGECCGSQVKFKREVIARHETEFQVPPDMTLTDKHGLLQLLTPDCYCVFLNRTDGRCSIYDDRPMVCRLYGIDKGSPCPYVNPDGTRRTTAEIDKHKRAVQRVVDFAEKHIFTKDKKGE